MLPNKIWFTGVPGSRWSAIAQTIEEIPDMNTGDRTPEREYNHHKYSGHKGAYFGKGMEFPALVIDNHVEQAFATQEGCKLIKSHEWADHLEGIQMLCPNEHTKIQQIYYQKLLEPIS